MSEGAWRTYASAPPEGTVLARAGDVRGAACVPVTSANGTFGLILVETAAGVRAYVNACPHQYLPLDYRGPQVLSADGTRLMCSSHGAAYRTADGVGVEGFGLGERLDPVPVHVDADGMVRVGAGDAPA